MHLPLFCGCVLLSALYLLPISIPHTVSLAPQAALLKKGSYLSQGGSSAHKTCTCTGEAVNCQRQLSPPFLTSGRPLRVVASRAAGIGAMWVGRRVHS
jgi:hypothetical protein